ACRAASRFARRSHHGSSRRQCKLQNSRCKHTAVATPGWKGQRFHPVIGLELLFAFFILHFEFPMSVFDKHRDALEVHETMMGSPRGRLAVALDLLTDALAMV